MFGAVILIYVCTKLAEFIFETPAPISETVCLLKDIFKNYTSKFKFFQMVKNNFFYTSVKTNLSVSEISLL